MTLLEAPEGLTIWQLELDRESFPPCLSHDEEERAAKFRFVRDQQRYRVCRSALRVLLGKALGLAPNALSFTYGPQGKPALADFPFSVSHSGNLALIALGADGVDLEQKRTDFDPHELGQHVFTESELAALSSHDDFFTIWTRKEALIKAEGGGFSSPLLTRTVWPEPECWVVERYDIQNLAAAPGFTAAICVKKAARL